MIDDLISDPKNIFELISTCILKVMNFQIFRDFFEIFLNLFIIIFNFKKNIKKWFYTAR